MNLILQENSNLFSITKTLKEKVPNNAVKYLSWVNFDEVYSSISTKHLVSNYWLVIITGKLKGEQLERLTALPNLYVFTVRSTKLYEEYSNLFKSKELEYRYIDNTKPSKNFIIETIMDDLNISSELAEFIAKRSNWYPPSIEQVLLTVRTFEKIDKATIKAYTEKRVSTPFYTLLYAILDVRDANNKTNVNSNRVKKCITLMKAYQYSIDTLLSFLKKELNKYLVVYGYIIEGTLSLKNYMEFEPSIEDKVFNSINKNQIPYIFDVFNQVSYDKLYMTYLNVNKIKPRRREIYKLIALL